jgi:hypothetical protein
MCDLPAQNFAKDNEDRTRPEGLFGKCHDQHAKDAAGRVRDHHTHRSPELEKEVKK